MSIQRGLAGCALVMAFLMTQAVSTAQPVAWGGGCQSTVGIRPCIAAYGPSMPLTVRTDWYLIGFGTAEYGGSYTEWTCIAGVSCTLMGAGDTTYLGRYPGGNRPSGMDAGSAWNEVAIWDASDNFQGVYYSPIQYWVP